MDTRQYKESRTFVPYVMLQRLLELQAWDRTQDCNNNDKDAVNAGIANAADFYKINGYAKELYNYPYKKDEDDGWYVTNKWMVDRFGMKQIIVDNNAKGYIETCYNVDYRTLNKRIHK